MKNQYSNKHIVIAIDGPAASGKTSVSRYIAKKLGITYIDSGAIYRAIAWSMKANNIPAQSKRKIASFLKTLNMRLCHSRNVFRLLIDGRDVTRFLRAQDVTDYASAIARIPVIREWVSEKQRSLARRQSVVAEGRDIGTVVFPRARFKFYLNATLEERVKRRILQNRRMRIASANENIARAIAFRDRQDSSRKHAPLKMAQDAYYIDTTGMSLIEVGKLILSIIEKPA